MWYNSNQSLYKLTQKQWYQQLTWYYVLWPFELLFRLIIYVRKYVYKHGIEKHTSIPIWIVGDISVGGSGKSPLIIWLATYIQSTGACVAIIAHGYQAKGLKQPQWCTADSDPKLFGDESVLLAKKTSAIVVCAKKRNDAVRYIHQHFPKTHVILCDDGLQDYRFHREKEIAILNKKRLGNGHCFPVGPLREPLCRFASVDLCIDRTIDTVTTHGSLYALKDQSPCKITQLKGDRVHAVSGIADNQAFFDMLTSKGLDVIPHSYADHYQYTELDARSWQDYPVIMTEKDAVKCLSFAQANWYAYPIDLAVSHRVRAVIDSWLDG